MGDRPLKNVDELEALLKEKGEEPLTPEERARWEERLRPKSEEERWAALVALAEDAKQRKPGCHEAEFAVRWGRSHLWAARDENFQRFVNWLRLLEESEELGAPIARLKEERPELYRALMWRREALPAAEKAKNESETVVALKAWAARNVEKRRPGDPERARFARLHDALSAIETAQELRSTLGHELLADPEVRRLLQQYGFRVD